MHKGYWVVAYRSVSDEAALKAYGVLAVKAIADNGGTIIVRTADAIAPREAGLMQRTVIVQFDSYVEAQRVYASDAYQAALRALGAGAERDFRIVEGLAG